MSEKISKEKAAYLKELSDLVSKFTPHDGSFSLIDGAVNLSRASKISQEQICLLAKPSICIVPQGAKSVDVSQSEQQFIEDGASMVVYSAEVPLKLRITAASPEAPFYCLMIPLKPEMLHQVALKVFPDGIPKAPQMRSVYVNDNDLGILKSAIKLMEVLQEKDLESLVAPLVIEEVLIRLLRSPIGPSIAQMGVLNSHSMKISKVISWIKNNYAQTISTEEMAKLAGMSVSSLHGHFKAMTAMSPLQFQKTVRLQEARSLIRTKLMDVTNVAFKVGYSSPSQFSREYSREFGISPSRDMVQEL